MAARARRCIRTCCQLFKVQEGFGFGRRKLHISRFVGHKRRNAVETLPLRRQGTEAHVKKTPSASKRRQAVICSLPSPVIERRARGNALFRNETILSEVAGVSTALRRRCHVGGLSVISWLACLAIAAAERLGTQLERLGGHSLAVDQAAVSARFSQWLTSASGKPPPSHGAIATESF